MGDLILPDWLYVYLGAICGHLLSLYAPDFQGSIPFLKKVLPEKKDSFYFRIDFLVLPIIGTFLGFALLEPEGTSPSFFAGITWSAALAAFLRGSNRNPTEPKN